GILEITTAYPSLGAMILYVTRDIAPVAVSHQPRAEGRSGYTFRRRLRVFTNVLINNSSFLLRVVGWLGALISTFSIALAINFAVRRLLQDTAVHGWTSVIVA